MRFCRLYGLRKLINIFMYDDTHWRENEIGFVLVTAFRKYLSVYKIPGSQPSSGGLFGSKPATGLFVSNTGKLFSTGFVLFLIVCSVWIMDWRKLILFGTAFYHSALSEGICRSFNTNNFIEKIFDTLSRNAL